MTENKLSKNVTVSLDPETERKLKEKCDYMGVGVSLYVRNIITRNIDKLDDLYFGK